MEERIRPWLDSLEGHRSCLAWVVRHASQPSIQRAWNSTLAVEALEYATRSVADLFRVLQLHKQPSRYLQWTFEEGALHCVQRLDGWILVVVAQRQPALPEEQLASWVQSFIDL